MRRSICLCEPKIAMAGEVNNWKFIYTPATTLPKGTLIKFDLMSRGRSIDWELPDPEGKESNFLTLQVEKEKPLFPELVDKEDEPVPQYEFQLPNKVEAGKTITITLGGKKKGNMAQTYVQRRRPFLLYVDTTGKGHYSAEAEPFSMDIRGNKLEAIKILVPSYVSRNRRFDITVRFEDAHGNLTANTLEDTLIELSYENLRDSLNWKLFIPETGFLHLPNLYFNEEGTYTICLKNLKTKQEFRSPPIRCFAETNVGLYWGLLHGESDRIDSTENIEGCLRHFRDDKALSFFGASPFESVEETPNDLWKTISQNLSDFDENERFTTFLGCQWMGEPKEEGLRQFIFSKDNKPLLRKTDGKYNALNKIYRQFSPGEMISIPCFTMGSGYSYNFQNWNSDFERVAEIYNSWGCSERTAREGNPTPIDCKGKNGVKETAEGSLLKALQNNCRFGFVGGGLDDRGLYGELYDSDQTQYPPGFTGIIAEEHTRESLMKALFERRCYATTGERIILGLYLAGLPMGSEVSTQQKPGLMINRHLSGFVAGTTKLATVELIRNGQVIKTFTSDSYHLDFEFDDMTPLEKHTLSPTGATNPFAFYYVRVTQKDHHMAWSSPIWVDYIKPEGKAKNNKAK